MRILILDDDEVRLERLRGALIVSFAGAEISQASCVDGAKSLMRASYFDVLICDVVIPRHADGKDPSRTNSIDMLSQLTRSPSLKKPEKIIGITAHLDDIEDSKRDFEQFCSIVIEARSGFDWIDRVREYISYTFSSIASRIAPVCGIQVFTVHGIRTYGAWQDGLRRLVESRRDDVKFSTYKYGYFSAIRFLLAATRRAEVERLSHRLRSISLVRGAKVVVFSHSFGTYLTMSAIEPLLDDVVNNDISLTIVLSGSVLGSNFDLAKFRSAPNVRVVNECGSRDAVLYLSALLGSGLGMAGKVGFNGFVDGRFVNRFFVGGHSHYFEGRFMEMYWLPLIFEDRECFPLDHRVCGQGSWVVLDQAINLLSGALIPSLLLMALALGSLCLLMAGI